MGTTGNVSESHRSLIHCCSPTRTLKVIPILSPADSIRGGSSDGGGGGGGGVEPRWSVELWAQNRQGREACLNIFTLLDFPPLAPFRFPHNESWKEPGEAKRGWREEEKRGWKRGEEAGTFLIPPKAVPTKGLHSGAGMERPPARMALNGSWEEWMNEKRNEKNELGRKPY